MSKYYHIKTLGCQMNLHDSERMAGLLEQDGYLPASEEQIENGELDAYVINTCAIRENAATKLYGNLGHLAALKKKNPDLQIAVGGCLAQKDTFNIIKKAPWVDVVFGTYNLQNLVTLLKQARVTGSSQVETFDSFRMFSTSLPSVRKSKVCAWVPISVGCNNACTFCIVPSLRGKEVDRDPDDIIDEIKRLADDGVKEVTLLGQNVNSYGQQMRDRRAFSKLLRRVGEIKDIKRVRFVSPHPQGFTDDVIEAMAETETVMPHLHMPLQSGSDKILKLMRRGYNISRFRDRYLKLKEAIPNIAITTDIIIGFPYETEEDFLETYDFLKELEFDSAYVFNYSVRPNTPAAEMPQIDYDIKLDRFNRLYQMQEDITLKRAQRFEGKTCEVLLDDEGRKDKETHRITGRLDTNHLVHINVPQNFTISDSDPFVNAKIIHAAPHSLIADLVE